MLHVTLLHVTMLHVTMLHVTMLHVTPKNRFNNALLLNEPVQVKS